MPPRASPLPLSSPKSTATISISSLSPNSFEPIIPSKLPTIQLTKAGIAATQEEEGQVLEALRDISPAVSETATSIIESEVIEEEIEEEESSSEEESDEEEEPTLKYSRLEGSIPDILLKDSASAVAVSSKFIVLGTHNGGIFVLDFEGIVWKKFRPHQAGVNDLSIDDGSEFIGSASLDGKVSIQSLTTPESYIFDLKRPMRCIALEPNFGKRSTRQFVSGGMAGNLILHEKGWLGHKEVILHSGEGPIWAVSWKAGLIAWANDAGVKIYDTVSQQRITYISRAENSPRADLFKCTLYWQDSTTLLIAWADFIKVAKVKEKQSKRPLPGLGLVGTVGLGQVELFVQVQSIFQVDCMISGITPYGKEDFLILAYITEEEENEDTQNPEEQKRKIGSRPELRIISKDGDELSSDALSLRSYEKFQCRDYSLFPAPTGKSFYVISPKDIIISKRRDEEDHIGWLIEQKLYEKALTALEKVGVKTGFDKAQVGGKYLDWLVGDGQFGKAAETFGKILEGNSKLWEDWIFLFAEKGELKTIIPYVPTQEPQLGRLVYEMILAHYLRYDQMALLKTIKQWPHDIYDVAAVIVAVKDQLERNPTATILTECLAELFILNRQPGKALPYFLQLRRAGVFALIKDNNLFTDVQDQALGLIEFDLDIQKSRNRERNATDSSWVDVAEEENVPKHGTAIALLVDHTHSIPIARVIAQLHKHRNYLFMYLDALFDKDPHLAFDYSDLQVELYSEFNINKLMDFLRASNYYSLEKAYKICDELDMVPEMVFLLGRMGDNKRALRLIIERLGDVQRAIEFVQGEGDDDLWEDLLKYSEDKPEFIRGLLQNVGAEIDPIRLIKRIRNGLEIPGLKLALIKILQDFNLQISLMEGCKTILYSDCRQLAVTLHESQTNGFLWTESTQSQTTKQDIYPHLAGGEMPTTLPIAARYLCNHKHTFDVQALLDDSAVSKNSLLANKLLETELNLVPATRPVSKKLNAANAELMIKKSRCSVCV